MQVSNLVAFGHPRVFLARGGVRNTKLARCPKVMFSSPMSVLRTPAANFAGVPRRTSGGHRRRSLASGCGMASSPSAMSTKISHEQSAPEGKKPLELNSTHGAHGTAAVCHPLGKIFEAALLAAAFALQRFRLACCAIGRSCELPASRSEQAVSGIMMTGLLGTALTDLSGNHVFMSAFWSWLTAQLMKYVTTFYREGKWDWRVMFDSGGMPSSHTSLVVGLTTAIAYHYGLGSTLFPLSLAFSLIVMYDAAGVRRHAGKQAEVLNRILDDMFKGQSISERKLKEVLGHSPLQVLAGAVLGVFIGVVYMYKYSSGYGIGV